MRKMKALWMVLLVGIGLSPACSGPAVRMTEWRDDAFTTCCLKKSCDEKEWMETAKQYCTGNVSMVGGKYVPGIAGYETSSKGDNVKLSPVVSEQSCRIFKCTGSIVPPR